MDETTKPGGTTPIPAPTSPTGIPWLPPVAAKYLGLTVLLALAVLGVLMGCYPNVHGFAVAFAVSSAVAGVLGIASPGLRTPTVGLLLCVGLLSATGCATLTATEKATLRQEAIDCGKVVLTNGPSQAASCATSAISQICVPGDDQCWASSLKQCAIGALDTDALAIVVCEIHVGLQALSECLSGSDAGTCSAVASTPALPASAKLARLKVAAALLPATK
jgi:hypothetical protein